MAYRRPSMDELKLLMALIDKHANVILVPENFESNLLVEEMNDGNMGSLRLFIYGYGAKRKYKPKLGKSGIGTYTIFRKTTLW